VTLRWEPHAATDTEQQTFDSSHDSMRQGWGGTFGQLRTYVGGLAGMARKAMDPVVHFELPYDDRERMATFYRGAFGWETTLLGPEMGNYVLATTARPAADGAPAPGKINGGFYPKHAEWPAQFPSVVIAVADIRAAMRAVSEAGGQVLGEPIAIPGVGQYVSFFDTEGNRNSILEALPRERTAPKTI
jgi:predicted enzyme related to lactoylglutathione lyase